MNAGVYDSRDDDHSDQDIEPRVGFLADQRRGGGLALDVWGRLIDRIDIRHAVPQGKK
jgi:hypothetical protein